MVFAGFFEGKKVLVTGVTGVKGTWLALELLEAGGQVVGVDIKSPDARSNFTMAGLAERIEFVQGDVTDLPLMRKLTGSADCIFHLAAIALVGDARRRPLDTYRSNTLGTATVLEAIRLSEVVKYAVFVTTDKVYKPKGGDVWVETDPLVATGPYPVSKACADYIIADYYTGYLRDAGKRVGVGRAGNVMVGGDLNSSSRTGGAGRIFVDCFEALAENRPPEIFTPRFTRPYTYGLDILTGYMTLMSKLDCDGVSGEAFNFGPHEQYGVENGLLATKICELWGSGVMWQSGPPRDEPFEKQSLCWDKARLQLGWQPAYTLYETLRETTRWYKEWAGNGEAVSEGDLWEFNVSLVKEHRGAARRLGIAWADGA